MGNEIEKPSHMKWDNETERIEILEIHESIPLCKGRPEDLVRDVDTSSWRPGTVLYPGVSGGYTPYKPSEEAEYLGFVVRQHATKGVIAMHTQLKDFDTPDDSEDSTNG